MDYKRRLNSTDPSNNNDSLPETLVKTKRQSRRSQVKVDVSMRHGEHFEKGQLVDLGTGGLFIHCEQLPPIGNTVDLELSVPTAWEPLKIKAQVRWINEGLIPRSQRGFGAEFMNLREQVHSAVQELLWIHQVA